MKAGIILKTLASLVSMFVDPLLWSENGTDDVARLLSIIMLKTDSRQSEYLPTFYPRGCKI